ncbi:MAG: formate dehydrogenase accessory sulfurtransferase FdhD [Proteobacteria bacterium]|nr:formate dehydrogenase accessory sulfurtransferase FdhD [Pseudomonadota bacterium]MBU1595705.1 formate dehydrogenase accessory sulfurtransferase FdhD [Pseudomonadota bacterium]
MPEAYPFEITEYGPAGPERKQIQAIREVPLTIYLNGREVVTLLCTGKHPRHLAVGFLKSDALISDPSQLLDVDIADEDGRITARVRVSHDPFAGGREIQRSITSGCGKGTNFDRNVATISRRRVTSELSVSPAQILALAGELKRRSTLYDSTRGCHNSSLCTPQEMLLFREDIGRHNAIDMIVGECFLEGLTTHDKMIVSTGRVASEILLKTVRIGVSVLASTAVATSFSVELARKIGLTLIGNIKADSFWVYNDPGRIIA